MIIPIYGIFSYLLAWWLRSLIKHKPTERIKTIYVKEVSYMIRFKDFDSMVAKAEGKKDNDSIANVREVRKIIFNLLKKMGIEERNKFIERQR